MKMSKNMLRGSLLSLVCAFAVISNSITASATGTGSFEIGGFIQPENNPVDQNTAANWANIAATGIDTIAVHGLGGPYSSTLNKSNNETGIANSSANNVKLLVTDSGIYGHPIYTAADYAALNSALTPYVNDARVAGFSLKDEPWQTEFEGYANAYKYIKSLKPGWQTYMNFMSWEGNGYLIPGKLVLSNSKAKENGSYVSSTNSIGQTFKVPANVTYIDGIEMLIDSSQWSSSEILTLKLWNSPSKTTLLGQAAITGTGQSGEDHNYPYFPVHATVTSGTTYYMELTHNGGGDNSVGWVVRSNSDVYADGTGYEAGVAKPYDFFFRLYTTRSNIGTNFENIWDDWLGMSGADYILHDIYPFKADSNGNPYDDPNYFSISEMVRDRALANDVPYGAFLQSIHIKNPTTGMDTYPDPNMNMLRWNVYTYLTYGYKKMYWFTYWRPRANSGEAYYDTPVDFDGTKLTKYAQIQTLDSEMKNLSGTLKNLTSRKVYHTGSSIPSGTTALPSTFFVKPADLTQPMIIGHFTNSSGRSYVMLTNRDYNNSRTLDFNFSSKPSGLTEISKTTGAEGSLAQGTYNATNGILNITLLPGEGRLIALPAGSQPYANLAANAAVTATSSLEATAWGWALNRVNDDLRNSANRSFGWSSNSNTSTNHTESVTFDLGSSKTVSEVDLYPRNDTSGHIGTGFPLNFNIQVATSPGGPWTTVITKTGYSLSGNYVQPFTFSPQTARYVKVEGTSLRQIADESGQPYRMQLAEVEIYGSNQPQPNMIANPDFQTGTLGPWSAEWHPSNGGVEANYPHNTMNDGYLWPTTSGDVAIYQTFTAPATKSYTLTAYCASNITSGDVRLGVDAGGTQVGQQTITPNVGYAPYTITFNATAGQIVKLWYYGNAAGGWATIDDVVLN
ncbi:discoidin domain-containing protein [Paenibacillus sp. GCM10027628]|uniref:discoidin domain-containing protein n=1 Tax=Paenibacillus sp. GCM10027628 TaxID=3273413 RepID=UPI003644CC1A